MRTCFFEWKKRVDDAQRELFNLAAKDGTFSSFMDEQAAFLCMYKHIDLVRAKKSFA